MVAPFADHLLEFIVKLRSAGGGVSVAGFLDALRAIGVAGREGSWLGGALRASLIKDEADGSIFDALFSIYFGVSQRSPGLRRQSKSTYAGLVGSSHGDPGSLNIPPRSYPNPIEASEGMREGVRAEPAGQ